MIFFGSIHKVKPPGVRKAHRKFCLNSPIMYKLIKFATFRDTIGGDIGIGLGKFLKIFLIFLESKTPRGPRSSSQIFFEFPKNLKYFNLLPGG